MNTTAARAKIALLTFTSHKLILIQIIHIQIAGARAIQDVARITVGSGSSYDMGPRNQKSDVQFLSSSR
jgi:hypothetical protein